MIKKYILVCAFACISILSNAQDADTVSKKIAELQYTKCEIPPQLKNGSIIERFFPENFGKTIEMQGKTRGSVVAELLIDSLGNLRYVHLIKNESPDIDRETLRILDKTEWKPAFIIRRT
jgi:hypothetical protein